MAHLQSLSKDMSLPASHTSSFTLFTRFRALCSSATLEMIARRRPLTQNDFLCLVTVVISLSLSFCLTFCCTVLHSLNPLTPCPEKAEGLDKRDRGCSWGGRLFLERILHRENRLFLLLPRLCKWSHLWSRPPLHPRWWFVPHSRVHISAKDFTSYTPVDQGNISNNLV